MRIPYLLYHMSRQTEKSQNYCISHHCISCCQATNMLLSLKDIQRIEKLGYMRSVFAKKSKGWIQLRNVQGRCVFHDGTHCRIYDHRPEGCRLYPVVFDKDNNQAIRDKGCPQKQYFSITQDKIKRLQFLVSTLEHERVLRKK